MKGYAKAIKDNSAIIRAMLADDEFLCGGIFGKEAYYMKKYGLSFEEMSRMETHVYKAVMAGTAFGKE